MSYAIFRDKNLRPENIKKGVKIFRTVGTLEGGGTITNEDITADSSTLEQIFTASSGYDGIGLFTLLPYVLDTKTVNSSTNSQTVTSDHDGLSSVTVNPYVLDSKTVDSSTVSQTVTSSVDGLSSVTVNPYVLDTKTVDPSTSQVVVNSSVDGMSSVTVNAVTSSIDSNIQAGNIKSGVSILGVAGNYDAGGDWVAKARKGQISDLSQYTPQPSRNYGCYGLLRTSGNTASLFTKYPVINLSGYSNAFANACYNAVLNNGTTDNVYPTSNPYIIHGATIGDSELSNAFARNTSITDTGYWNVLFDELTSITPNSAFYAAFYGNKGLRSISFPLLTTIGSNNYPNYIFNQAFQNCTNLTSVSFPSLTTIKCGSACFKQAFQNCTNLTSVSFPSLTTIDFTGSNGAQPFSQAFQGCGNLTNLSFPELVTAVNPFQLSFINIVSMSTPKLSAWTSNLNADAFSSGTSVRTIVTHPNPLRFNSNMNLYWSCSGTTSLTLTANATNHVRLNNMSALDDNSIINILSHLDLNTSGKTCTFYTSGLTITDDAQGTVQALYDAAVRAGWTIANLTIVAPSNIVITHPTSSLNLAVENEIIFDALNTWTASVSDQDIQLSSYSGPAGSNQTVTVTMTQGFTGPATVTFSSGGDTATVNVINQVITFVNYVAMPTAQNVQVNLDDEFTNTSCVEFDAMATSSNYMQIGNNKGYSSGSSYHARLILFYATGHLFDYPSDSGSYRTTISRNDITANNRFTLEIDQYNNGTYYTKCTVNGTNSYTAGNPYSTDTSGHGHKFGLFSTYCNSSTDLGYATVGFRIYGFKWYEYINGVKTLIHDLKPALNPSNVPGFYDTVTEQFILPSQGTLDYA